MSRRCDLTNKCAQFGNNVSHAQNKNRRRFSVNLQNVSLESNALKQSIKLKIAVSTLRSIDFKGGLDNYLTSTSNSKLSEKAVVLKKKINKVLDQEKSAEKSEKAKAA